MSKLPHLDVSLLQEWESILRLVDQGASKISPTALERDGVIRRYEYAFDLGCRILHAVLLTISDSNLKYSPKVVIEDAYDKDLIEDLEVWAQYIWAQTAYSKKFDEETAKKIFALAATFPAACQNVIARIKREL